MFSINLMISICFVFNCFLIIHWRNKKTINNFNNKSNTRVGSACQRIYVFHHKYYCYIRFQPTIGFQYAYRPPPHIYFFKKGFFFEMAKYSKNIFKTMGSTSWF